MITSMTVHEDSYGPTDSVYIPAIRVVTIFETREEARQYQFLIKAIGDEYAFAQELRKAADEIEELVRNDS